MGEPGFAVDPLPVDLDVPFDDFPRFHLSRIVAALRGEAPDWPTFDDGLRAQLAVEAVEASQRSGRWIPLDNPYPAIPACRP
jgi:predicted dehydrogenase